MLILFCLGLFKYNNLKTYLYTMSMRVNGIIANRYAGRTINQAEQKSKNILEFKIQRTKQK